MLTAEQFEKARQYIFRYGRLIDRQRYLYHFASVPKERFVQALACYQNEDGGFGHGLELDIMCPASNVVCTEMAMFYLDEVHATDHSMVDRLQGWIESFLLVGEKPPHPRDEIMAHPHGGWWEEESGSLFSLVGMLGKWGRGSDALFERAQELFRREPELGDELGVYQYPENLYLRYAPGSDEFCARLERIKELFPQMLEKFAWHFPLICHPFGWLTDDIEHDLLAGEAGKAVAALRDDGCIAMSQYEKLPWWFPVWTLDMLVTLKTYDLLDAGSAGDWAMENDVPLAIAFMAGSHGDTSDAESASPPCSRIKALRPNPCSKTRDTFTKHVPKTRQSTDDSSFLASM